MKRVTLALCTIHGVQFQAQDADGEILPCPACERAAHRKTAALLEEAQEHRALLLRAIDLKRTVVRAGSAPPTSAKRSA